MVTALVALAWLPAVLFPLIYLRSRWWTTLPGRSLMAFACVTAAMMTLAVARQVGYTAPEWTRAGAYLAISAALWAQLVTLLIVRRRSHRRLQVARPTGDH